MILNTKVIQDYIKMLNLVATSNVDDYVYINSEHSKLYLSSSSVACVLEIEVTSEEGDKVLVLSRNEFFHVVSNCTSLQINNKYEYHTGTFRGVFKSNDEYSACINDVKEMFRDEDAYEHLLNLNTSLVKEITKAGFFVNSTDNNLASRGVHFIGNTIASSSLFRIYSKTLDSFDLKEPVFIPYTILKFIGSLSNDYTLSRKDTLYLLKDNYIQIVFSDVADVAPLPIHEERYLQAIEVIKEHSTIVLNLGEVIPKIEFLSFFVTADKKKNGLTQLVLDKDSNMCYLKVDDNCVDINLNNESKINENNEFFINLLVLKDILIKLDKDISKATLYCDVTSRMLFIELATNQTVLFSKINA